MAKAYLKPMRQRVAHAASLSPTAAGTALGGGLAARLLSPLWSYSDRIATEHALGGNLPKDFPAIDSWDSATETATSIKTISFRADSYKISDSAIRARTAPWGPPRRTASRSIQQR